jgi:hypothetical protein
MSGLSLDMAHATAISDHADDLAERFENCQPADDEHRPVDERALWTPLSVRWCRIQLFRPLRFRPGSAEIRARFVPQRNGIERYLDNIG